MNTNFSLVFPPLQQPRCQRRLGACLPVLIFFSLLLSISTGFGYTSGQFLSGSNQDNNYGCVAVGPGNVFYGAWKANNPAPSFIKFATFNGSAWTEIPSASFTGPNVAAQLPGLDGISDWGPESMVVDASGNIHIIFGVGASAGGANSLRGLAYGKFTAASSTWAFRRLFILQHASGFRNVGNGDYSLKLDASQNPHVVFQWSDASDDPVREARIQYAFFNGTTWNVSGNTNAMDAIQIDVSTFNNQEEVQYLDTVFDSAGDLHCCYRKERADLITGDAWYSKRTGGVWSAPVEIAHVGDFYGGYMVSNSSNHISIADVTQVSAASFNYRIITNASGSFVASNVASYTVPGSTSTTPGIALIAINSAGRRVIGVPLTASNGATKLAPQYRLAYETAPGVWAQEAAFTDATTQSISWGAMNMRSDNTVMALFHRSDADNTPDVRNLYFATGIPTGIGVGGSVAPTVTTDTQSSVTHNSAVLGGNVTADGGASVTERGIVWNTATGPTTANNKVQNGSGTGAFSATVGSLPSSTTIYVRAYAINSVNTSYGNEISFITLAPPAPEIAVTGNGNNIADGSLLAAASATNGTDFGSTPVQGGVVEITYTIANSGNAALNLTNGPSFVSVSPATDFSVTQQPTTPVAISGGTTTFKIAFNPTTAATTSATVSFGNDDGNESPFDFMIKGTGTGPQTFDLAGNAVSNTPFDGGQTYIYSAVVAVVPVPVSSPAGDVVTGGGAPDASGADSGADFDVLKRGGYLAENGHLVFPGQLLIGSGSPPVTLSPNTFMGLWKQNGTGLKLLARSGDPAPETGPTAPTSAKFDVLPQTPAINDSGEVTFLASLATNPSSTPPTTTDNDTGLWSELGGTGLGILIREGDVIPGLSPLQVGAFASGAFATAHTGATTGEAAFAITIKDGAALTDTAILRTSVTSAAVTAVGLVARENAAAPGTAETFGNLAGTYTDPMRMDATGNLAFVALTKPSGKEGLWYQPVAGATAKVFVAGDTAPGTTGATFKNIKSPAIGGEGTITFRGLINADGDNAGGLKNDGIWRGTTAGGFTCILRRGDTAVPGLPVGSKVGNLWHSWLTNANHGAWKGWLDVDGNGTSAAPTDVYALYSDLSGTMNFVLKVGDAAPGIAGATFSGFDLPVVGGVEQMAFIGNVTGGGTTSANNSGVWRSAPNGGALTLVIRTGDTITTSQGARVIQKVDFPGSGSTDRRWEQPIMDATGRLIVFVTFTSASGGGTSQILVP